MHATVGNLVWKPGRWLTCVVFACLLWSCGDDSPPQNRIITGSQDAEADATDASDSTQDAPSDARSDVDLDPACDGVEEGGSCALPNAVGVCVRGECRFLSCESGFRSCDDTVENGCEAEVTTNSRCGTCTTSCPSAASCQLSNVGYICSTTPVCQEGRFDLDGDISNGCEYRIEDVGTFVARPGDLDVQRGDLVGDTFWYAGAAPAGAIVGATDVDENPDVITAFSSGPGRVLEVVAQTDKDQITTAWEQGITRTTPPQSSSDDPLARTECVGRSNQPLLTGLDRTNASIAATEHGIFELRTGADCEADECLLPIFDRVDYLRSYYPYTSSPHPDVATDPQYALSEQRFAGCDTCFFDEGSGAMTAELGCLGDTVCASEAASDCATCDTTLDACPDFRPIAVRSNESGTHLVVATEQGVLVLVNEGGEWKAGPRAEGFMTSEAPPGNTTARTAAVTIQDGVATVFLLGADERFFVARIDLDADTGVQVERAPFRLALPLDTMSTKIQPGTREEFLVSSSRGAVLVRSTPRGTVQEPIPAPEASIDAPVLVASGFDEDARTYGLLYKSLGQFILRTVSYEPMGEGDAQ